MCSWRAPADLEGEITVLPRGDLAGLGPTKGAPVSLKLPPDLPRRQSSVPAAPPSAVPFTQRAFEFKGSALFLLGAILLAAWLLLPGKRIEIVGPGVIP